MMSERVVALVDMDCFYCQVEERLNPELQGKPTVVVQYNPWKGGGIIAVNYEARARGVKRGMRGEEAKQLCHDVVLCSVPMIREKADLSRYRDAGREVVNVMCTFSECVQRASIDEAYLDLTSIVENRLGNYVSSIPPSQLPNTFIVGYSDQSSNDEVQRSEGTSCWLKDLYSSGLEDVGSRKLAVGAIVVEEMRQAIFEKTGFRCSAGIAHNKILAKLAAGFHKPNRQTVLPQTGVAELYSNLPVHKIRSLGGKLGRELSDLHGVKVMKDLLKFSQPDLIKLCDERMGIWLYNIARGHDNEPVTPRLVSKSIACCKNFPGKMSLSKDKEVDHWLNKLSEELLERLVEDETLNQRKATHMVFSIRLLEGKASDRGREIASSKSVPLQSYSFRRLVNSARTCLKKFCSQDPTTLCWSPIITFLGLSAGKFVDTSNKLVKMFDAMKNSKRTTEITSEVENHVASVDSTIHNMDEIDSAAIVSTVEEKFPLVAPDENNPNVSPEHGADTPNRNASFNESAGPSFFEKILLDNQVDRLQLNIVPVIAQTSPRKKYHNLFEKFTSELDNEPSNVKNKHSTGTGSSTNQVESKTNQNPEEQKQSLKAFFKKKSSQDWVDPLEIFPDLQSIDDETLALFPPTYRRRIVEMKRKISCLKAESHVVKRMPDEPDLTSNAEPSSSACQDTAAANQLGFQVGKAVQREPKILPSSSDEHLGCKEALSSRPFSPNDSSSSSIDDVPFRSHPSTTVHPSPSNNTDQSALEIVCPDCQLILSATEYDEHRDYHYAMQLQEEMNGSRLSTISKQPTSVAKTIQGSTKRKNSSKNLKSNESKKPRSIDSFFKRNS